MNCIYPFLKVTYPSISICAIMYVWNDVQTTMMNSRFWDSELFFLHSKKFPSIISRSWHYFLKIIYSLKSMTYQKSQRIFKDKNENKLYTSTLSYDGINWDWTGPPAAHYHKSGEYRCSPTYGGWLAIFWYESNTYSVENI